MRGVRLLTLIALLLPLLPISTTANTAVNARFIDDRGSFPAIFEGEICPAGRERGAWWFNVTILRPGGADRRAISDQENTQKRGWANVGDYPCDYTGRPFTWLVTGDGITLAGGGQSTRPWSFTLEGDFQGGRLLVSTQP